MQNIHALTDITVVGREIHKIRVVRDGLLICCNLRRRDVHSQQTKGTKTKQLFNNHDFCFHFLLVYILYMLECKIVSKGVFLSEKCTTPPTGPCPPFY